MPMMSDILIVICVVILTMRRTNNKLTTIAVSKENYLALKRLGNAGDSFNDVVTEVLKKVKQPLQTDIRVGASVN
jgi:hypothetical protein